MKDRAGRSNGARGRALAGAMQEALRRAGLVSTQPQAPTTRQTLEKKQAAGSGQPQQEAKSRQTTGEQNGGGQGNQPPKSRQKSGSSAQKHAFKLPRTHADKEGQQPPSGPRRKIQHLLLDHDAGPSKRTDTAAKPIGGKEERSSEQREARIEKQLEDLATATERRERLAAASCAPSAKDLDDLRERLAGRSGPAVSTRRGAPPMDIVLGIDFGTTSTKIVARFPYLPGSPACAIPAPAFARAENHAYLWASRLWLTERGIFSLCPLERSSVSCAIKAHLMRAAADKSVVQSGSMKATAAEVATAFLALQIRQAHGWLKSKKAALLAKKSLRFSYNFGFPAASLNAASLKDRYQRCIAAALILFEREGELSLVDVRKALQFTEGGAEAVLQEAQAELFPEIAAAVSGFAKSLGREDGLYALVDVGGGTVDCCTFNLVNDALRGGRCPIFRAEVKMLGVDPWRLCREDLDLAEDFRWLLNTLQRSVIWQTKRDRYPTSERWQTALPVFFTGGGIASDLHRESTHSLDKWLRHHTHGSAGVRIETLPAPANFEHPLCADAAVQRLVVAIGLSQEAGYIPDVELPGSIPDAPAPGRKFTAERNDDD
jgi:hypothetical protein